MRDDEHPSIDGGRGEGTWPCSAVLVIWTVCWFDTVVASVALVHVLASLYLLIAIVMKTTL